jgi:hypothetical protein
VVTILACVWRVCVSNIWRGSGIYGCLNVIRTKLVLQIVKVKCVHTWIHLACSTWNWRGEYTRKATALHDVLEYPWAIYGTLQWAPCRKHTLGRKLAVYGRSVPEYGAQEQMCVWRGKAAGMCAFKLLHLDPYLTSLLAWGLGSSQVWDSQS